MTRTGDWEIRSVSGKLPDNPGELARMSMLCLFALEPININIGGPERGQISVCVTTFVTATIAA